MVWQSFRCQLGYGTMCTFNSATTEKTLTYNFDILVVTWFGPLCCCRWSLRQFIQLQDIVQRTYEHGIFRPCSNSSGMSGMSFTNRSSCATLSRSNFVVLLPSNAFKLSLPSTVDMLQMSLLNEFKHSNFNDTPEILSVFPELDICKTLLLWWHSTMFVFTFASVMQKFQTLECYLFINARNGVADTVLGSINGCEMPILPPTQWTIQPPGLKLLKNDWPLIKWISPTMPATTTSTQQPSTTTAPAAPTWTSFICRSLEDSLVPKVCQKFVNVRS